MCDDSHPVPRDLVHLGQANCRHSGRRQTRLPARLSALHFYLIPRQSTLALTMPRGVEKATKLMMEDIEPPVSSTGIASRWDPKDLDAKAPVYTPGTGLYFFAVPDPLANLSDAPI